MSIEYKSRIKSICIRTKKKKNKYSSASPGFLTQFFFFRFVINTVNLNKFTCRFLISIFINNHQFRAYGVAHKLFLFTRILIMCRLSNLPHVLTAVIVATPFLFSPDHQANIQETRAQKSIRLSPVYFPKKKRKNRGKILLK